MFTIIRWIFSLALLILAGYLAILTWKALQKEGAGNVFSGLGSGVGELFSGIGMETSATATKTTLKDFFTPKQIVAPMQVVPSQDWYQNMDAVYKQIYIQNMGYANVYATNSFSYNSFFSKYDASTTATNTNLKLLFPTPSNYMQLRNAIK